MSTSEMKKSDVVNLLDFRAAKEVERAEAAKAAIEGRAKATHSAVMNGVIGTLQVYGIDARNLKGLGVVSRALHEVLSEHIAKGGKLDMPIDNPPNNVA